MPEVVCPAPQKIVHCLNLVPDGIKGGSSFGHDLDFGFELHHAFLTRPEVFLPPINLIELAKSVLECRNHRFWAGCGYNLVLKNNHRYN